MSIGEHLAFDSFTDWAEVAHLVGRPITELVEEIQNVYLMDTRPWVVGYSGGKDSTVVLQLVYYALATLPADKRTKPIFAISSDTLVETPLVVDLITATLETINKSAKESEIPLTSHIVYPKTGETFWVNLLGKGFQQRAVVLFKSQIHQLVDRLCLVFQRSPLINLSTQGGQPPHHTLGSVRHIPERRFNGLFFELSDLFLFSRKVKDAP